MNFDLYVWAAARDLDADAAAERIEAWEATGGDPAGAPFEPSTDIGWFRRELLDSVPWLDVTADAVPRQTPRTDVLSGLRAPGARFDTLSRAEGAVRGGVRAWRPSTVRS